MIQDKPFIEFQIEETNLPDPGQPVIIATPFEVFKVTWLGEVDGKAWTLTDACRLMQELKDAEMD